MSSIFNITCPEDYEAHQEAWEEMQALIAEEAANTTDFIEFEKDGYVPTPADFEEMAWVFAQMG
jgi:hypothetical protein